MTSDEGSRRDMRNFQQRAGQDPARFPAGWWVLLFAVIAVAAVATLTLTLHRHGFLALDVHL